MDTTLHFKQNYTSRLITGLMLTVLSLGMVGCSDDDDDDDDALATGVPTESPRYELTLVNATANQPLSPIAVIAHSANYSAWKAGEPASLTLETLAEGGDNSSLLSSAGGSSEVMATVSGAGAIAPGHAETVTLSPNASAYLTVATMLVNTNDAFAGISGYDMSSLTVGETVRVSMPVYDAGTEANTEHAGTIPGPADGGTGFDASREGDSNIVTIHAGVVSHDDGLSDSVLDQSHRFDNPAAILSIKRVE